MTLTLPMPLFHPAPEGAGDPPTSPLTTTGPATDRQGWQTAVPEPDQPTGGAAAGASLRAEPESVTGVQLAQGIGHRPARGFWAEAWGQVLRRPGAVFGLVWISVVGFFAVFAPVLASGHPLVLRVLGEDGGVAETTYPLLRYLSAADVLLLLAAGAGAVWIAAPLPIRRSSRAWALVLAAVQGGAVVMLAAAVHGFFNQQYPEDWVRRIRDAAWLPWTAAGAAAVLAAAPFLFAQIFGSVWRNLLIVAPVAVVSGAVVAGNWKVPLESFDYRERELAGEVEATYTLVPFSPNEATTSRYYRPPGTRVNETYRMVEAPEGGDRFVLGTDGRGRDVLSQLLHACRLSISIGLVSTSIAVVIGVTVGALMGYFGGWVDILLYRVVEVFMAIPLLFLLIVAAAVLPRNTYVMMIIIGCVTWTGAARFTRAEFLKLRGQDFVQSAKSVGLPLRSILFKHMLPNGVTPVLVDASFAIAAAILIEATLSFLALGPVDQPSWGALLSNAKSETGLFVWWLAIFPGAAIFLTVLAYNLIGEAMRDAIDPKLKKARV